jgi:hypothetical protein
MEGVVGREYDRGLGVNEDRLLDTDDARHLRVEIVVRDGKVLHIKKDGNKVTLVGMGEAVDNAQEHGGSYLSGPDRHGVPWVAAIFRRVWGQSAQSLRGAGSLANARCSATGVWRSL